MFTGIIESSATIQSVAPHGTGRTFWLNSPIAPELKVDQSLSHNGVCLTVEEITGDRFRVTAIEETLRKTTVGSWKTGTVLNLERCLMVNSRLDGHFVQGHVDTTGTCLNRETLDGSWEFTISFPPSFAALVIEKGSICVDGISLTAFAVTEHSFTIAIIPYTFNNTSIGSLTVGGRVNLEFDLFGKYIQRRLALDLNASQPAS
jgi:riboflavin synthase